MRKGGRLLTTRGRCELSPDGPNEAGKRGSRRDEIQGSCGARLKGNRSSCRWFGRQYSRRRKLRETAASRSKQYRNIARISLVGAITLGKKARSACRSPSAERRTNTTNFKTGREGIFNIHTVRNARVGRPSTCIKTCLDTRFNEEILEIYCQGREGGILLRC